MRGHGLIFLDGDKTNTNQDNLMVVSKEELQEFHKSQHQKLTAEYTKSVIVALRLKQKLAELEQRKV